MRRSTRLSAASTTAAAADGQPNNKDGASDETSDADDQNSPADVTGTPATKRKADEMTTAPSLSDASDESAYESKAAPQKKKKAPAKKKAPKKKKSSWLDLAKPSTVSFEHVPIEILDLIVSVDSDLGLRDHLALAGTCRFFRACYNDLVWQVLFQALCPRACMDPYEILICHVPQKARWLRAAYPSDPVSIDTYIDRHADFGPQARMSGPFVRSLNHARHIFSNGIGGAPGSERWGQSQAVWEAGRPERWTLRQRTARAVAADAKMPRLYDPYFDMTLVAEGIFHFEMFDDPTDQEKRQNDRVSRVQEFMQNTRLMSQKMHRLPDEWTATDPWPSLYRHLVAMAVDRPTLTKKGSKEFFRVKDAELRTLPLLTKNPGMPYEGRRSELPKTGGYRLSQVEALALRSHQGPDGLKRHLEALKEKRRKAEERKQAAEAAKQAAGEEAGTSAGAGTSAQAADAQAMNVDDELDLPNGWPADDVENVEDGVIGGW